jgi:hypothetical protein
MRTISSAAVLAATLWSSGAHALVESKCLTPQGLLRGTIQILPNADTERRRPCVGMQTEVLTEVVDVFPRNRQAEQRAMAFGLVPRAAAAPIVIEGAAVNRTDWLRQFPAHAADGEALGVVIDILEPEDGHFVGHGCALWLVHSGEYEPADPAFHNLNGQPQAFQFTDHVPAIVTVPQHWRHRLPSSSDQRRTAMLAWTAARFGSRCRTVLCSRSPTLR